jgi:hypothetical protein
MAVRRASGKGFQRTSNLLEGRIRAASESRGFAQSRLLTHWAEIAGPEVAQIARPVEVTYARGGFGATLVLLTTGSNAPMLEMQKEKLRDRVNATYGYNAIARVRITQTAPVGFAEGQVQFAPAPKVSKPAPSADARADAAKTTAPIENLELRDALELLGANIISRTNR